MGLKRIQPYASYRVLRQLGRCQTVPQEEDLSAQDRSKGEVAPGYLAWYRRELEQERPAKKLHLQEFVKASREQWDWLDKEHEYRATIGKLEKQVMDLKFEKDLHIAEDEGEKRKLAQENEVLKTEIQEMKIAARSQERSQSDKRLINGLKKKVLEYKEDLEKSKVGLARIQVKWIKKAEEKVRFMQQMKRDYEGNIAILRETISTLKEQIFRQARDARTDRKRYYDLMAQMEKQINEFQDRLLYDAQVPGTRNQQIERLLMERDRIKGRIDDIGHYITIKCLAFEDMSCTTFFASIMIYVHHIMKI
ncbi:uncharacterized protein [Nicotiana sylvestris]|uniref:uncharacterized protein n=1 Tax=Nicotiana sylvestris TaxID=4096 RepID=UPI00388C4A46